MQYVDESGTLAFSPDDPVVTAIRFPATTDVLASIEVPRVAALGGSGRYDTGYGPPFTGNGFTSAPDSIVPELHIPRPVAIPDGAEMWSSTAHGQQVLVGVFEDGRWVRVES